MGDRGTIVVLQHGRSEGPDGALFFYTHWSGTEIPQTLAAALDRGRDRWGDESYLARIIFNQLTAGVEMETTGYGITTYFCETEHPIPVVDAYAQTVSVIPTVLFGPLTVDDLIRPDARVYTFDEFVAAFYEPAVA